MKTYVLDGKIIMKCILERDGRAWGVFILLMPRTGGGLLFTRLRTFGFHIIWEIC